MADASAITPVECGQLQSSQTTVDASAITPAECGQLKSSETTDAHDAVEETIHNISETTENNLLKCRSTKIYRFPSNLRRIGTERDYIAPRIVAIGPYYHGEPKLQPFEGFKRMVAKDFFREVEESREETYERIKVIARQVRECYADADALKVISDDEFAEMMFVDGCFLVQFLDAMSGGYKESSSIIHPHMISIMRDMMLLENQIPWPVMEDLIALKRINMERVIGPLAIHIHGNVSEEEMKNIEGYNTCKPSHLLCLIRLFEATSPHVTTSIPELSGKTLQISTSAAELAEIGIKLESRGMQLSAMRVVKKTFSATARLSLSPFYLDNLSACFLVNMCIETCWSDLCPINSYIAVLSLLMTKEEDVRELRAKRIVHGSSDHQTLEFFKGLQASNWLQGTAYQRIIVGLANYKHDRRVWIAIYRFVYNNSKIIATVLSIIGVLAGIFKTLLSLKQNQH